MRLLRVQIKACTDPKSQVNRQVSMRTVWETGQRWKQWIVLVYLTHYGCGRSPRREETLVFVCKSLISPVGYCHSTMGHILDLPSPGATVYRLLMVLCLFTTSMCIHMDSVGSHSMFTCESIGLRMCQDLPYNTTFMPNLLNHYDQQTAALAMEVRERGLIYDIYCWDWWAGSWVVMELFVALWWYWII